MMSLKERRDRYSHHITCFSENNDEGIRLGLELATALLSCKRSIECYRLLQKLLTISSTLQNENSGRSANTAADIEKVVKECMSTGRCVKWHTRGELMTFEAQCYKHGGATCILKVLRPIPYHSSDRIGAPTNEICFEVGNIVVCVKLDKAVHLNGKIGEIISLDNDNNTGRYGVRFEDAQMKPVSVKKENLRIAVDFFRDNGVVEENGQKKKEANAKKKEPQLIASTSTQWYLDREEENKITPKQRLIHFCELRSLSNGDSILEENTAKIDTPYSYWGLCPTSNMKNILRYNHCGSVDFTWIVDNEDLVEPYFDEVSKMGPAISDNWTLHQTVRSSQHHHESCWADTIEYLKNEILIDRSKDTMDKATRRKLRNVESNYPELMSIPVMNQTIHKFAKFIPPDC